MNGEVILEGGEWTRKSVVPGRVKAANTKRLVLVGARIKNEWLDQPVLTTEVRFEGELASALSDLADVARQVSKKTGMALPISRLRASIVARVRGLVGLDRDLGIERRDRERQ